MITKVREFGRNIKLTPMRMRDSFDLTHKNLSLSTTEGRNPIISVSFRPEGLPRLSRLPRLRGLRGEIPCIALSSSLLTIVTQLFESLSAARQVGVMELWNCAVFSLLPLLQFNIFATSKF